MLVYSDLPPFLLVHLDYQLPFFATPGGERGKSLSRAKKNRWRELSKVEQIILRTDILL
jgi:hypothetical protein